MRIRILQTLDSGVDEFPFMPGQVINVPHPPPWLLSYLDGEKAVRLPDEEEIAVAPEPVSADAVTVTTPEAAAPIVATAALRSGKKRRG